MPLTPEYKSQILERWLGHMETMDKKIKKIQKDTKKLAKEEKSLLKADKKRDKACEMGSKMMKKKKK